MIRRRLPLLASLALASLLSSGCATSTYQTAPLAHEASEAPADDMCRIYVGRAGARGSVREIEIRLEGETVGKIAHGGYLCWDQRPGRVVGQAIFHGGEFDKNLDGSPNEAVFAFEGEPGRTYYFEVAVDRKTNRPKATELDAEAGDAMVAGRTAPSVR